MRRIGAALAAMVVLAAGVAAIAGSQPNSRLALPPAGEAAPAFLRDGLPVFVVHDQDGDVRVFDARNPHRTQWWTLVGWCPSSGLFEDPWDGSRFTVAGEWVGGPAPRGLVPYEARREEGVVVVGRPGEAAPRDPRLRDGQVNLPEFAPRGPSCLSTEEARPAEEHLVLHDALLESRVAPVGQAMRGRRATGSAWMPVAGALLAVPGEQTRLCSHITGDAPRCQGPVPWRGPAFEASWPGLQWIHYEGTMLVEAAGGRARDVAVLSGGTLEHRVTGVEREFALADELVDRGTHADLIVVPARWLSGREADAEARRDGVIGAGESVPNDHYVDVEHPELRGSHRLAGDVVVLGSVLLEGNVELAPSSLDALSEALARMDLVPVWLHVRRADGRVIRIEEQYRP